MVSQSGCGRRALLGTLGSSSGLCTWNSATTSINCAVTESFCSTIVVNIAGLTTPNRGSYAVSATATSSPAGAALTAPGLRIGGAFVAADLKATLSSSVAAAANTVLALTFRFTDKTVVGDKISVSILPDLITGGSFALAIAGIPTLTGVAGTNGVTLLGSWLSGSNVLVVSSLCVYLSLLSFSCGRCCVSLSFHFFKT